MGTIDDANRLLRRSQRVILDTNILVLWVAGNTALNLLDRLPNTGKGTTNREDFELLADALRHLPPAHRFVVTPHVATETWYHLESNFTDPIRSQLKRTFASYAETASERRPSLRRIVSHDRFVRLGVADVAQFLVFGRTTTVVTDDAELAAALETDGRGVVNLAWLRFPTS